MKPSMTEFTFVRMDILICRLCVFGMLASIVSGKPELSCHAQALWFYEALIPWLKCPTNCLNIDAAVWGSVEAPYSIDSSICRAAIHQGVFVGDNTNAGWVELDRPGGKYKFAGTWSNGVKSKSKSWLFGRLYLGVYVRIPEFPPSGSSEPSIDVSCFDRAESFSSKHLIVRCPPGCGRYPATTYGVLFGSARPYYYTSSSICRAGIDAGVVTDAGGIVSYTWKGTVPFPAKADAIPVDTFAMDMMEGVGEFDRNTPLVPNSEDVLLFNDLPTSCFSVYDVDATVVSDKGFLSWLCTNNVGNCYKLFCDNRDGGGWIVIQRRVNSEEGFYRKWDDYVTGFGDPLKNFWIGLEPLRQFVSSGGYELRIDMTDFYGVQRFAHYSKFLIGPNHDYYPITVDGYTGNAGDSLTCQNHSPFSTYDHRNGVKSLVNCATLLQGGWWYNEKCGESNLNGRYRTLEQQLKDPIVAVPFWKSWAPTHDTIPVHPLMKVEMMIRKISKEEIPL